MLPLKDACTMYGLKYDTIYKKWKAGEFITVYRMGRSLFVNVKDLDAWMHRDPVIIETPSLIRAAI